MACGTNDDKYKTTLDVTPQEANWEEVPPSGALLFSDNPETVCQNNAGPDQTQGVLWQHTEPRARGRHRVFLWHVNHLPNAQATQLAVTIQATQAPVHVYNIRYEWGYTGPGGNNDLGIEIAACLLSKLPNSVPDFTINTSGQVNQILAFPWIHNTWDGNDPCHGGLARDNIHGAQLEFDVDGGSPEKNAGYVIRVLFCPSNISPTTVTTKAVNPWEPSGPPGDPIGRGSWFYSEVIAPYVIYEIPPAGPPPTKGWFMYHNKNMALFTPQFSDDQDNCQQNHPQCAGSDDALYGGVSNAILRLHNGCNQDVPLWIIMMPRGGSLVGAYQLEEIQCSIQSWIRHLSVPVHRLNHLRVLLSTGKPKHVLWREYVVLKKLTLPRNSYRCFYLKFAMGGGGTAPAAVFVTPHIPPAPP